MSVPAIASCNVRSIFEKTNELDILLKSGVYKKIGIMCLQKTWLHGSIDTSLVTLDGFSTHRVDRHGSRDGGILTFIRNDWFKSVERVFT